MTWVILEEKEGDKTRDFICLCDGTENILTFTILETSFSDKKRNFHWSISAGKTQRS